MTDDLRLAALLLDGLPSTKLSAGEAMGGAGVCACSRTAQFRLHVGRPPACQCCRTLQQHTLSNNKLTGTLPPELGAAWPAMENLELNNNTFMGPLPKEWSRMGRLKTLILR